ncbi:hypothetical protein D9757_006937 [Collybiopsis confluens]|uniref:Uncharacterized protein n=1 Tax=Collybiopsis confluens TaxID=2823264 RepID=A0A8H5HIP2_9AGAR|nr:hypothetical protein D9757_006937 [Collybiopsis confluens]
MPLRGLFSKKNKSRTDIRDSIPGSPTTPATESQTASPTTEYVKPDSFLPSSPNGRSTLHPEDAFSSPSKSLKSSVYSSLSTSPASGSSSRLRLPFGRKRAVKSSSSNNGHQDDDTGLRPPFIGRLSTGAASEADAAEYRPKLGPPPSRSAIFAAYGDPNSSNSTRSLPTEYPTSASAIETETPPPKRPIFPWSSKSQPNTTKVKNKKSLPPKPEDISAALEESSFNLKSFRHLGNPSSPELPPPPVPRRDVIPDSANSSAASLVPPRPLPGTRSRNSSFGSVTDPSASQQRISVAAFREAQARRSQAGSPVPSARSPSPGPNISAHHRMNPSNQGNGVRQRRTSLVALGRSSYTSDEDDSSDDNDDDDDSDANRVDRNGRAGKSSMFKSKAKSEAGHGSNTTSLYSNNRPVRPALPSLRPDAALKIATPRSKSDVFGQGLSEEKTAVLAGSVSGGALSLHSAPAAPSSPPLPNTRTPAAKSANGTRPSRTSDSDSDDSDNAPLATLVPPKRPGSAASTRSNPQSDAQSVGSAGRPGGMRSRVISNAPSKPLIDIKELTGPKQRPPESGVINQPQKSQEGFTGGATLLSMGGAHSSSTVKPLSLVSSSVISTDPPGRRFVSPPPSPPATHKPPARSESTSPSVAPKAIGGLAQRRIPMGRSDTDTLSMASSTTTTSSNDGSSGGKKKDLFSERLSKVVAHSVGSSPTATSPPTSLPSPRSRPLRQGNAPPTMIADPSADLNIPFTSSPSPTLEKPQISYRRALSPDIKEKNPAVRAPSPKVSGPIPARRINYSADRKSAEVDRKSRDSETMEDLAELLGAGIKLVSVNGEDQPEMELPFSATSATYGRAAMKKKEKDDDEDFVHLAYDEPPAPSSSRITPIMVKTIPPVSSFSVTSRPQHSRGTSINVLSSTSTATVVRSPGGTTTTTTSATTTETIKTKGPPSASVTRPRSSTLIPTSSSTDMVTWKAAAAAAKSTTPDTKPSVPTPALPAPSSFGKAKVTVSSVATSSSSSSESESESESDDSGSEPAASSRKGGGGHPKPGRQRPSPSQPSQPLPRSKNVSQMPAASSQSSRFVEPSKPFASSQSPASSTGGSSSGRGAPITPRDGSDVGNGRNLPKSSKEETWGSGVSGLNFGPAKHAHGRKKSIAFEDESGADGKGKNKETPMEEEARRKERRRSEARAAIELGNTINGRGPVLDDEDEDLPISQSASAPRMNPMNPMMMNGPPPGMPGMLAPQITGGSMWGWPSMPQMPGGQMLSPAQFMVPPPIDPAMFAAHQQAMMYAKQAYQMAVAQQAMAAAAEEWDRGSTIGFSSSQSMYGMPPSALPSMMSPGFGVGGNNNWSTGSMIFPASSSRMSMYGSGAMSEYGGNGGRGGGNWNSSKSVYGESFGPSSPSPRNPPLGSRPRMSSHIRDSTLHPPVPPIPSHANSSKNSGPSGPSTHSRDPRTRAVSQPARPSVRHHDSSHPTGRKAPPSSWKTNGS